jgi:hypothetical protein
MLEAKLSTLKILLSECSLHRNKDTAVYTYETIKYKQCFLFVAT